MADHPNAARYRAVAESIGRGEADMAVLLDSLSDDVEWWEIGRTEPIRGKQALVEHMTTDLSDYTITFDVHDVVANDEHLIALGNANATRGDKSFDYRTAEIYHTDADGKITHRWAFSDDTAAIIEFFAD
jgi:ketosteroid isomerase-like protein